MSRDTLVHHLPHLTQESFGDTVAIPPPFELMVPNRGAATRLGAASYHISMDILAYFNM